MRERYPDRMPRKNKDWSGILAVAAQIVRSYDTGVTLRQLFYQLVIRQLIENNISRYGYLSTITAEARRNGDFPDLVDQRSEILEPNYFLTPEQAIKSLATRFRRDRTEGQAVSLYLAVEKAGIQNQLWEWFGRSLGLPILALGGYGSQSYKDLVKRDVQQRIYVDEIADGVAHKVRVSDLGRRVANRPKPRPAVLIYAGDHDASGDDIYRDFVERTGCWVATHRIALTKEQVQERNLPQSIGDKDDSRQPAFNREHGYPEGSKIQVELDALTPDVLRGLYQGVINHYWDDDAYQDALVREDEERYQLERITLPKREPRPDDIS